MPKYNFVAKKEDGKLIENLVEAKSRYEAMDRLKERDLTIISISSSDSSKKVKLKEFIADKKKKRSSLLKRVTGSELSVFCRQLSISINSGIPLIDALQSIADDMDNDYFKGVLLDVINEIHNGRHFSEAITKYKKIFSSVFIALVKSAEESGSMNQVFEYLSLHLERGVRLKQKISSITAYPIFIILFFVFAVLVVTIFVLPKFDTIFSSFGAELPLITRIVFSINKFFIRNAPLFFTGIGGVIAGFIIYNRTLNGRLRIDKLKLNLPFLGRLIKKVSIARFCRVLAAMVRGGVSIDIAIETASESCGNKVLEKSLEEVTTQIMGGSNISAGLGKDSNFPRLMVRMVSVGESSARLPEVLDKISDMYEDQVEGSIMVATSLFEPIAITLFGGVILTLILSIYLPVFKSAMSMGG